MIKPDRLIPSPPNKLVAQAEFFAVGGEDVEPSLGLGFEIIEQGAADQAGAAEEYSCFFRYGWLH